MNIDLLSAKKTLTHSLRLTLSHVETFVPIHLSSFSKQILPKSRKFLGSRLRATSQWKNKGDERAVEGDSPTFGDVPLVKTRQVVLPGHVVITRAAPCARTHSAGLKDEETWSLVLIRELETDFTSRFTAGGLPAELSLG